MILAWASLEAEIHVLRTNVKETDPQGVDTAVDGFPRAKSHGTGATRAGRGVSEEEIPGVRPKTAVTQESPRLSRIAKFHGGENNAAMSSAKRAQGPPRLFR